MDTQLVALESSRQKMINTVITHKKRIVKATNEILGKLSELQKSTSGKEISLSKKAS